MTRKAAHRISPAYLKQPWERPFCEKCSLPWSGTWPIHWTDDGEFAWRCPRCRTINTADFEAGVVEQRVQ